MTETTTVKRPKRGKKADLDKLLPQVQLRTVFDVGANVGQTVAWFAKHYPEAEVWAFEPSRPTYEELVQAVADNPRAHPHHVALGASNHSAFVSKERKSVDNHVVERPPRGHDLDPVDVHSGDSFLARESIEHVDYLKIDTEGHELHVLRGFQKSLADEKIDLVELEVGMNHLNLKHVPLARVMGFLEPAGYLLFRLYEQVSERGQPNLRRANAVFMSERVLDAHRRRRRPA